MDVGHETIEGVGGVYAVDIEVKRSDAARKKGMVDMVIGGKA